MQKYNMEDPATASWGLSISNTDFEKLKAGFQSRSWDEKWTISAGDQSLDGIISIHFARFTGPEFYILHVKPSDGGSSSDVKIEAITWEQKKGGTLEAEEQAKEEVVRIARSNLRVGLGAFRE